jgi:hypothetical protein
VEDSELAQGLTDDPDEAEVLIRPADLFSMADPQGDCDDFAQGTAALLLALNIPAAIKTVKCNPHQKKNWSHVYVVAQLPSGPLALDASFGPYPGWEPSTIYDSQLWPVTPMTLAAQPKTINVAALRGAAASLRGLGDLVDSGDPYVPVDSSTTDTSSTDTSGGSGFDWGSLVGGLTKGATSILGTRYGVPQLNAGQYIRMANGSVMYQQPAGATAGMSIPGLTGSAGGSGMLLLLAVVAIVLFISMNHKG